MEIEFRREELSPSERSVVSEGFDAHTKELNAPEYRKEHVKWLALDEQHDVKATLTADILWDWIYVDELWVSAEYRGQGLGRKLMQHAEDFALSEGLQGIWLWTQSWQAEGFYRQLGYKQFTRFENFPKGYSRIGFRKHLSKAFGAPQAEE